MTLDSKTYLRVSVHDIKIVELDCCQIPEHLSSLPNFVWVRVAQFFSFLCSILSTILLLIVPFVFVIVLSVLFELRSILSTILLLIVPFLFVIALSVLFELRSILTLCRPYHNTM